MQRSFISASVALFTLAIAFSVVGVANADHSWGSYHWARTANPFTLKLGDNVSSAWDAYLSEASADWSASSVLNTVVVPGSTNARTCKSVTGTVQVCNSRYGNNGWLGIASIWANSAGHITKGTAKMNDTYFDTASYNTPAWRRLVMCQEIAHDFGLDHQDEAFNNANLGTCMDYTNDPDGGAGGVANNDPSNEHPNAHDFEQLETIYAHLDSGTTLSQFVENAFGSVRPARSLNAENEEFGTATGRRDNRGRENEFTRRDRESGQTVLTHVFWLPE